jgi:hypothetical protein
MAASTSNARKPHGEPTNRARQASSPAGQIAVPSALRRDDLIVPYFPGYPKWRDGERSDTDGNAVDQERGGPSSGSAWARRAQLGRPDTSHSA